MFSMVPHLELLSLVTTLPLEGGVGRGGATLPPAPAYEL
jgi:hypothetical protein